MRAQMSDIVLHFFAAGLRAGVDRDTKELVKMTFKSRTISIFVIVEKSKWLYTLKMLDFEPSHESKVLHEVHLGCPYAGTYRPGNLLHVVSRSHENFTSRDDPFHLRANDTSDWSRSGSVRRRHAVTQDLSAVYDDKSADERPIVKVALLIGGVSRYTRCVCGLELQTY